MVGLPPELVDKIDAEQVIARVIADVRTDFIPAPHYNIVFTRQGGELAERAIQLLRNGQYQPGVPYTISVPKERGFSRPGSILAPIDRFVYQALIDLVSPTLEDEIDRSRTFSHRLSDNGPAMFLPGPICWQQFQEALTNICGQEGFVLKADVANYFDRIPQHHLINLMNAAKCPAGATNLLEEVLLAFRERNSFGIIQGLAPSDVLGNFFLSEFDAYCELHEIPSARYVDDMYLHFANKVDAGRGLVALSERLLQNGLHVNEYKSGIRPADEIIREETEVDEWFAEARQDIQEGVATEVNLGYGFTAEWSVGEELEDDEYDIDLAAIEQLYQARANYPHQSDKIEKFCLPALRAAGSEFAIDDTLSSLRNKPHMTRVYLSYLSRFVDDNRDLVRELERFARSTVLVFDYQRLYALAALLNAPRVERRTLLLALRWLVNRQVAPSVRAIAAVFAAKHGIAAQKRAVRLAYENEPSPFVQESILYSTKFLPPAERRACRKAWGGHSVTNTLISSSLRGAGEGQ